MIHRVVDAEEAVVGVLERIDGDGAVLCIVALQVEGKLLGDVARIDLCTHTVGTLVEQGQHRVVHIVVEQDDAALGTADKVTDKGVGVEDLPVVEDALVGRTLPSSNRLKTSSRRWSVSAMWVANSNWWCSMTSRRWKTKALVAKKCRIEVNARIIRMLASIAIGERNMPLNIATPFSVKANGSFRVPPQPESGLFSLSFPLDVTNCDFKFSNSVFVSRNMKSSGKRDRFRFTAWFKVLVSTP